MRFTSTGFGYAAVWQKDCITRSPRSPGTPGLSVHHGSSGLWFLRAYRSHFRFTVRARTNAFTPQARPTIFCASEKPRSLSAHLSPDGTHHCAADQVLHALCGQATPDNQWNTAASTHFINSTSVFSSKVASSSPVSWLRTHLCTGKRQSRRPCSG